VGINSCTANPHKQLVSYLPQSLLAEIDVISEFCVHRIKTEIIGPWLVGSSEGAFDKMSQMAPHLSHTTNALANQLVD
jgi:hypothetical protein